MQSYHKINTALEMTRRVSPSEVKKINAQLERLPDIQKNIANLQLAVDQPQWESDCIIHDDLMPFYALLAYQNDQIKKISFGTLLLYWAITQSHQYKRQEIQMHYLFDQEKGEMSQQILKECVLYRPRDVRHKAFYFTEQMFQEFLEELRKLPISEQRFFLMPHTIGSIVDILEGQFVGFRVFGTFKNQYMVTSVGIMQAYLSFKFGANAILMNLVIGYSSISDIRENGLTDQRDFALHFPFVYLPVKADGHLAPWDKFSKHDFYHAVTCSNMPPIHRYLIISLSDAIKNEEKSPLKEFFYNYFIDMEGFSYITEDYETGEDKFWGYLQGAIYLYKFKHGIENSLILYQDVFFDLFDVLINKKDAALIMSVLDLGFSNIKKTVNDNKVTANLNLIKEIWDIYKEQMNFQLLPKKRDNTPLQENRASLTYCG